ncbi:MAG: DUF4159 domain-containing protein [Phycisphaerales bacterium]|nr:DUF4159 domain-containing protein [Phycisphaerales bacterium]
MSLDLRRLALAAAMVLPIIEPLRLVPAAQDPPQEAAVVQVAHLVYDQNKTAQCFASGYLDLLTRETEIKVNREPARIALDSPQLYDYPFAVLSGEGAFTFTDEQFTAIRQYIERGGFILASAGCSSADWNRSFRHEIAQVFADVPLEPLELDEDIFQTVFHITSLRTKTNKASVQLYGLRFNGRLAMIYSPEGLNDTGNAGGGCCCCGGNEIRDAKYINANVLAWVLTH